MEWQNIESAPKDEFVLLYKDGAMRCGLWEDGKWVPAEIPILIDKVGNQIVSRELEQLRGERLALAGFLHEPTHWMRLPEPPAMTANTQTPDLVEPFAWADRLAWHKPAHRAVMANVALGSWMSAALDDPKVCEAMKADIREWFSAGEPMETLGQLIEHQATELSRLREALEQGAAFLAKLDECLPHIEGIVGLQTARGYPYTGPQFGVEMEAFRQALERLS